MIFKKWKNIIGMYFGTKSYLKSNHYHTVKYAWSWWSCQPEMLLLRGDAELKNCCSRLGTGLLLSANKYSCCNSVQRWCCSAAGRPSTQRSCMLVLRCHGGRAWKVKLLPVAECWAGGKEQSAICWTERMKILQLLLDWEERLELVSPWLLWNEISPGLLWGLWWFEGYFWVCFRLERLRSKAAAVLAKR
jgi:hypothetical protein